MPLNMNAIKLAKILEIDSAKANRLFDILPISELAALTTALNADDGRTVQEIYSKYENELRDLPDADEVKKFFATQEQDSESHEEALANTADFFGIKAEDVETLLNEIPEEDENKEEEYIPDQEVRDAFDNINEMLKGGKSRNVVFENCKRAWQRRMMLGMIPPAVSVVIQKTLDLTPLAAMQKHAQLSGYGEPALEESKLSLQEMIEKILEHTLNNFKESKEKDKKKDDNDLKNIIDKSEENEETDEDKDLPAKKIAKPIDADDRLKGNVKLLIDDIKKRKFD